jgi:hypothetical protein
VTYQRFLAALAEARKTMPDCRWARMNADTIDAIVRDYDATVGNGHLEHEAGCWILLAILPDGHAEFLNDKALLDWQLDHQSARDV